VIRARLRKGGGEPAPWALLSYLLRYPEDGLADAPGEVGALPAGEIRTALERFLDGLPEPVTLRAAYVDTFDLRRRVTLHLTYYEHGDTRRRGAALLRLKRLYREAGLEFEADELPDHLAVMLAFAALAPDGYGAALLAEHLPQIELLRAGLQAAESPYAHVLDAVAAALPPLRADQRAHADRLADGAPDERVGIGPYVPEEVMPIP
jgi:nitrate reductase molybdenum cofactor assembly chaperone NarJ/NarW